VIFWDLGKKDNIELEQLTEADVCATLEIADFDEDADL
jgi:hypothetical protein